MLTADELIAGADRPTQNVTLPIRGGIVEVRSLSAIEVLGLERAIRDEKDMDRRLAIQVSYYLSAPRLSVDQAVTFLSNAHPKDVRAILRAGLALNRIDDEGIEDAEKN